MNKKFLAILLGATSMIGINAAQPQIAAASRMEESKDSLKDSVSKQFKVFVKGSKEMMSQYEGFLSSLKETKKEKNGLSDADIERILEALCYSAECHQAQVRKNAKKTPYISHPLSVAQSIVKLGKVYDADVIMAALLFDTIHDTHATFFDIRQKFGDKVEGYVRELSEDMNLSAAKRKKLQIIQASSKSKGAATIKLSEKLFNLNNLMHEPPMEWTRDRIDQYFLWAQALVESLPEANKPLKEEVHKVIAQYWKKQA